MRIRVNQIKGLVLSKCNIILLLYLDFHFKITKALEFHQIHEIETKEDVHHPNQVTNATLGGTLQGKVHYK